MRGEISWALLSSFLNHWTCEVGAVGGSSKLYRSRRVQHLRGAASGSEGPTLELEEEGVTEGEALAMVAKSASALASWAAACSLRMGGVTSLGRTAGRAAGGGVALEDASGLAERWGCCKTGGGSDGTGGGAAVILGAVQVASSWGRRGGKEGKRTFREVSRAS